MSGLGHTPTHLNKVPKVNVVLLGATHDVCIRVTKRAVYRIGRVGVTSVPVCVGVALQSEFQATHVVHEVEPYSFSSVPVSFSNSNSRACWEDKQETSRHLPSLERVI